MLLLCGESHEPAEGPPRAAAAAEWFARHLPRVWLGCYGAGVPATAWGRAGRRGGRAAGGVPAWQRPAAGLLAAWARAGAALPAAAPPSQRFAASARALAAALAAGGGGGGVVAAGWAEQVRAAARSSPPVLRASAALCTVCAAWR